MGENFRQRYHSCIAENFTGFYFHQCGKGRYVHCVIINTREKKNLAAKIFANGSKWQNWRKFSPSKKYLLYGILAAYLIDVIERGYSGKKGEWSSK